jgi:hypothetical protein
MHLSSANKRKPVSALFSSVSDDEATPRLMAEAQRQSML